MSQTVFILGAGASREAGGPLMSDFLDVAEGLQRSSEAQPFQFQDVFSAISALSAAHSKSALELDNIESVFAAFEMATLFGKPLGSLGPDVVGRLSHQMRRMIARTLELSIEYQFSDGRVKPPVPYEQFVELLQEINKRQRASISIITFNYDIALDYAFNYCGLSSDYCLGASRMPNSAPLLKLHGSLNWARCKKCMGIVPWGIREYTQRFQHSSYAGNVFKEIVRHLKDFSHCDQQVDEEPVIIPPTWNKTQYHQEIARIWRAASDELSNAENIIVIGYSLPPTDQFFRFLYAIGTIGPSRIKNFWVFDPDPTGQVEARFRSLLGQAALSRFRFSQVVFRNAIATIRDYLLRN